MFLLLGRKLERSSCSADAARNDFADKAIARGRSAIPAAVPAVGVNPSCATSNGRDEIAAASGEAPPPRFFGSTKPTDPDPDARRMVRCEAALEAAS